VRAWYGSPVNRQVVIVAAALLVAMLGSNVPAPLYEMYRVRFGTTTFVMTAVFAAYPLALAVMLALFAGLPDRLGRRPVLAIGLIAAAAGSIFFATANGVAALFAGRVCAAIAIGAVGAAGPPALVELDPTGDRRRAALVATFALSFACGLAPFASGVLAVVTDAPLVVAFVAHVVLCAVVLVALVLVPETKPSGGGPHVVMPRLDAVGRRAFVTASLASGVVWWLASLFVSVVPAYVGTLLGVRSPALQGALALVVFVVSPVAQTLGRRLPDRVAMRSGLLLAAAAFATLLAAVPAHSLALFGFGSVVAGAAQGLGFLGAQSTINHIAAPAARARLSAAFYAITYICIGLPILGVGALTARAGLYAALTWVGGLLMTLGLLVAAAVPRETAQLPEAVSVS